MVSYNLSNIKESQITGSLHLSSGWFYLLCFSLLLFSLKNLVKHLPEQDQLNALAKYGNEYANLSEPEQFGVVVGKHIHTETCTPLRTLLDFTLFCFII